jgi:hypothetical protein
MHKAASTALLTILIAAAPAFSRCACEGPQTSLDDQTQKAASAARQLPSEGDRSIARSFRSKGLPADAEQYYRSAATKADSEVTAAKTGMTGASELEQIALHSAAVHREVASFFNQKGDAATAAVNWEMAISDEQAAHKTNADLSTEYGTVARLYEQAGKLAKAAEMFKRQADMLAAAHGRYDASTQFALSEYARLTRRANLAASTHM